MQLNERKGVTEMSLAEEERLIARGLGPDGVLLLVKKKIGAISARRLRVIVSGHEAADELARFFDSLEVGTETDRVGDDYHVVADISELKKDA